MEYTTLSLADLATEFDAMARDSASIFGALDQRQLNWQPDDTHWSVAQCFDHLLSANAQMFRSMDAAIREHVRDECGNGSRSCRGSSA